MADFNMDDMFNKIKSGAEKVSKEAERITKSAVSGVEKKAQETKIKYAIRDVEERLNNDYAAIGKSVHESFKNGETAEDYSEIFGRIDARIEEIDELKNSLYSLTGYIICPNCGSANNEEDAYCSKCGARMTEDE